MVVRPPTGGHYLQHRFVWLLLLDLCYELLPFFFTPNQVFVEHKMANATSFTYVDNLAISRVIKCGAIALFETLFLKNGDVTFILIQFVSLIRHLQ